MAQRDIEPAHYIEVADAFDAIATSADTTGETARSEAVGYARMAGDDPGGEQFATEYDLLAQQALQYIFDIGLRANGMDRLFLASGGNAARAEAYAAGQSFDEGTWTLRPARAPRSVAPPPSALGGQPGTEPEAWEFVKDIVGMMWPNADTDALDAAGGGWEQIAADIRSLAGDVRRADAPLAGIRSAEISSAESEVRDFAGDIEKVADAIDELGGHCIEYASDVRDAHTEVIEMLVQLAVEIAATVAISAALSVFTMGASAAVGAGAMAARIAMIGARIMTILTRVGGTAGRLAVRIRATRAALIPVANTFQKTARATIAVVSGTSASVLSEGIVQRRDANLLVAFGSGLVGGAVSEALVAPFGRYGERVVVQALAGSAGGAAGGASSGVMTDGSLDIRQVVIGGIGGAGFAGVGALRSGSRRDSSSSAADPGARSATGDGEREAPIVVGSNAQGAQADGQATRADYDGPSGAGGDVAGSGAGDAAPTIPAGDAPTSPTIEVAPPIAAEAGLPSAPAEVGAADAALPAVDAEPSADDIGAAFDDLQTQTDAAFDELQSDLDEEFDRLQNETAEAFDQLEADTAAASDDLRSDLGTAPDDTAGSVIDGADHSGTPYPDTGEPDARYGEPREDAGTVPPHYENPAEPNAGIAPLIVDPDAPFGRDAAGDPIADQDDWNSRYAMPDAADGTPGGPRWPANDGAVAGTRVHYSDVASLLRDHPELARLDRIGRDSGDYLTVAGTAFEQRGLTPGHKGMDLTEYELADALVPGVGVEVSIIDEALGYPGGGLQLRFFRADAEGAPIVDADGRIEFLSVRDAEDMGLL